MQASAQTLYPASILATVGPILLQATPGHRHRTPCPCPCRIRLCLCPCRIRPCLCLHQSLYLCPLALCTVLRLCWCIWLIYALCPCNSRISEHRACRPLQAGWGKAAADGPCNAIHSTLQEVAALCPCLSLCLLQKPILYQKFLFVESTK